MLSIVSSVLWCVSGGNARRQGFAPRPMPRPNIMTARAKVLRPVGRREPGGVTPYEERVYVLCKSIPSGKVVTYGEMARVLKSSPRAVGQAMRRNPFAPQVPCHRVIAADLRIGGFSGEWGEESEKVQKKRRMLQEEGVKFDERGNILRASVHVFGQAESKAKASV